MRNFITICSLVLLSISLGGCTQALGDIKNAAAGINSKANEAASSISLDAHSARAIEIQFNNQTFTLNNLFKSILRDVQWNYEKKEGQNKLTITGTWKNNGLFAEYNWANDIKKQLLENGQVEVTLSFENGLINEEKTLIAMHVNQHKLVEQSGKEALHVLYALYLIDETGSGN